MPATIPFSDLPFYLQSMPSVIPPEGLDESYTPVPYFNNLVAREVERRGEGIDVGVAVARPDSSVKRYDVTLLKPQSDAERVVNQALLEELVQFAVWQRGGPDVYLACPEEMRAGIREEYTAGGAQAFTVGLMTDVFGKLELHDVGYRNLPVTREVASRAAEGACEYAVGVDIGASNARFAARRGNDIVFTGEIKSDRWLGDKWTDPKEPYRLLCEGVGEAVKALGRNPDTINFCSAGVIADDNGIARANWADGIRKAVGMGDIKTLFREVGDAYDCKRVRARNDGAVTAYSGALAIGQPNIGGVAGGSSIAAGTVIDGQPTDHLDELAFIQASYERTPFEKLTGLGGGAAMFFTQQAIRRHVVNSGLDYLIDINEKDVPTILKGVQGLLADERTDQYVKDDARAVAQAYGAGLGHFVPFFHRIDPRISHVQVLGRVTSGGEFGDIILQTAKDVVARDYDGLNGLQLFMPQTDQEREFQQAYDVTRV